MNHLSERILFRNMTDLYSLDALPVQPHETGVLGANLLEINAVSSLFLLDAVMHTILGDHPTKHYPRICYRFPVGSAYTLENARLRGHNTLTCRQPGLLSLRLPTGGRDRKSEYQNPARPHRLHSIRITRPRHDLGIIKPTPCLLLNLLLPRPTTLSTHAGYNHLAR